MEFMTNKLMNINTTNIITSSNRLQNFETWTEPQVTGYGPSDEEKSDEWAFKGIDGRSYGILPKAMIVAFWKKKKLLAQTLVHHASEGVKRGQQLHRFQKQWKGTPP